MMMKRSAFVAALSLALAAGSAALAADATGKWSGEVKLPTGQSLPFVAHLKQQGDVVTGRLEGINGAPDVQITDGKVSGDTVTFSGVRQIQNEPVKFNYIAKPMGANGLHFQILRDDGKAAPLESHTTKVAAE